MKKSTFRFLSFISFALITQSGNQLASAKKSNHASPLLAIQNKDAKRDSVIASTPPKTAAVLDNNGLPSGNTDKKVPPKGRFYFDFNKAQIIDIIKVISEITQKSFIVPEKIRSQTITILNATPVTADEAYRVFLSALEANDVTVVKAGKFYKLIASQDGAKYPVPTYGPDNKEEIPPTDNIVTKIIRVEHGDANALSQIIRNFMSKSAQVAVYQASNALIISEYGSNLVRIQNIIDKLDSAGSNERIHLIPIRYASASEMAQKLSDLFDVKKGPKSAGPPGQAASSTEDSFSITKLIPDDRTNQIIAVSSESAFKQLLELIQKLDVPIGEDTGQVRVVALQNANAEDLAQVLSSLAQGQSRKKTGSINNIPVPIQNSAQGTSSASLFEGDVKITADKSTNSILVIASPHDFRSLKRMIDQLDIPRKQVLIEMAIMEVSVKNNYNVGVNWYGGVPQDAFGNAPAPFTKSTTLFSSPSGGNMATSAVSNGITGLLGSLAGGVAGMAGQMIQIDGPNGSKINVPSFAVMLKLLQESGSSNIISNPYLLATDNEEAEIEVGEKIPFVSGVSGLSSILGQGAGAAGASGAAAALSSGLSSLNNRVERIDLTLKIKLTPHINQHDKILLDIDEQFEDLIRQDNIAGLPQPVTAKRNLKSKIVLDDQQTVVLGGLMRDKITESETKYPILGDIPILGWLFKTKSWEKTKSNLLIVITPYVVRTRGDFQRIYQRKQAEHKSFVDLFYSNSKEYRAQIDYTHKNGPLVLMNKALKKELEKMENGGKGETGDVLVGPHGMQQEEFSVPYPKTKTSGIPLAPDTTRQIKQSGNDTLTPIEIKNTPSSLPTGGH